jgi:2-(1,2-epoxy-1,2-dihydrophenyl)acetyl-CoA isomerase
MGTAQSVRYECQNGIGLITLDRPPRNAFDVPMVEALHRVTRAAADDEAVRVIAIVGAGGQFCAGGDVKLMHARAADAPPLFKELTLHFHAAISALARAEKPVMTAVDGAAAGGGFSLAIAADVCVASDRAQLTFGYTGIGLPPDGSSSYTLPRLVGYRRAAWIALRNPTIPAEEACRLGLVSEVYPVADFEARWRALAADLAAGPTRAYAGAKRLLRASLARDLESQMEDEREAIAAGGATADFREGVAAFAAKRPARFTGR